MKLLFMRHAHAVSQLETDIVVGCAFEKPLSQEGQAQAHRIAQALPPLGIGRIYASTCLRTIQTAQAMGAALGLPVVESAHLIERSHGAFEGRPKSDVYTPSVIKTIHADQFRWTPPGGETLEQVLERLYTFLGGLEEGPPCLIVTHLMVLWALFHGCTGCHHSILPALRVENGALVEVDMTAPPTTTIPTPGLRLIRWNHSIR